MGILLKLNMTPQEPGPTSLQLIFQFLKDSWPMIGGIIAVWKTIDEVAKSYSRKQESKLKELIKLEVNPMIDKLTDSIDRLREDIGRMRP